MSHRGEPNHQPHHVGDAGGPLEGQTRDGGRAVANLSRAVSSAFGRDGASPVALEPELIEPEVAAIPASSETPKWPRKAIPAGPTAQPPGAGAATHPPTGHEGEAVLRDAALKQREAEAARHAEKKAAYRKAAEEAAMRAQDAGVADEAIIPDIAIDDSPEITLPRKRRGRQLPGELRQFSRWLVQLALALARVVMAGGSFAASSVSTYVSRHPVHFVSNAVLFGAIVVLGATGSAVNEELISMKLSDRTATEIASASRFSRNYSLTEIDKRGAREFLRVGAPPWMQHESIKAILEGARKAGLSLEHQAVLLATAEIESGFNPMAQAATSSACGIFQFIRATGATFGLKASDCMDPWKSTDAAIDHYMRNYKQRIEERVAPMNGAEKLLRMFELSYYLHHDGPLSKNPSDELKATVLAGTPYLFKFYEVLQADQELRDLEPTFLERFRARFDVVVATARKVPEDYIMPVVEKFSGSDGEGVESLGDASGETGAETAVAAEAATKGEAATAQN